MIILYYYIRILNIIIFVHRNSRPLDNTAPNRDCNDKPIVLTRVIYFFFFIIRRRVRLRIRVDLARPAEFSRPQNKKKRIQPCKSACNVHNVHIKSTRLYSDNIIITTIGLTVEITSCLVCTIPPMIPQ